jgi:hypothetical protein
LVISNPGGIDWRVTHGRQYSRNQGVVASELAAKFQQHIICHHQHHAMQGWDRFGRYVVIDNGGLFDYDQMHYALLDDTSHNTMKQGFTLYRNGVATLLSEHPFTDWSMWL